MRQHFSVIFAFEKFIAHFERFIAQSEDLSLISRIYRSIWGFIAQTRLTT